MRIETSLFRGDSEPLGLEMGIVYALYALIEVSYRRKIIFLETEGRKNCKLVGKIGLKNGWNRVGGRICI